MARPRTRSGEALSTTSNRARQRPPLPPIIDSADVARCAYNLYLARGREDGHDVEDWLQAERELRAGAGFDDEVEFL